MKIIELAKVNWNKVTAILTMVVIIFVGVGFLVTYLQINEAKKTTANLEQLLNNSIEQLEALNQTSTETAHHTIMVIYQAGSPYRVEVKECNYNQVNNIITYRLIVYEKGEDDNLSTIKFLIRTIFTFYTVDENDKQSLTRTDPDEHRLVYVPGQRTTSEFSLDNIFKLTENVKDETLYVRASFDFALYSEAKNIILTESKSSERPTYLNAFDKFDDQNTWVNLPEEPNTKCN